MRSLAEILHIDSNKYSDPRFGDIQKITRKATDIWYKEARPQEREETYDGLAIEMVNLVPLLTSNPRFYAEVAGRIHMQAIILMASRLTSQNAKCQRGTFGALSSEVSGMVNHRVTISSYVAVEMDGKDEKYPEIMAKYLDTHVPAPAAVLDLLKKSAGLPVIERRRATLGNRVINVGMGTPLQANKAVLV